MAFAKVIKGCSERCSVFKKNDEKKWCDSFLKTGDILEVISGPVKYGDVNASWCSDVSDAGLMGYAVKGGLGRKIWLSNNAVELLIKKINDPPKKNTLKLKKRLSKKEFLNQISDLI